MCLVNRSKQIHTEGTRKRIKKNKDVDRIRKQRKQTIKKSEVIDEKRREKEKTKTNQKRIKS